VKLRTVDDLVELAARNNAEWCDVFCRSHGIAGSFERGRWYTTRRPPPLYPDVVTLRPGLSAHATLARVTVGPGCHVKDSFADLDLDAAGFHPLFRAEWLARRAADGRRRPPTRWVPLTTRRELAEWEQARDDSPTGPGFFRPVLLEDLEIALLAGYAGDRIVAGAVGNGTGRVVGLSNVFSTDGDLEAAWVAALAAVIDLWGDMPVVAYERGEELEAAHRAGMGTIGELRVWIHP
jgi:hypothetical protein